MTNAAVKIEPVSVPTTIVDRPVPSGGPEDRFLAMLERVARDPASDVEKVRVLYSLRRDEEDRIFRREAEREFNQALAQAQGKLRAVAADSNNPQTRSKYASYAALDRAVRPAYSAAGLSLSFDTEPTPSENIIRLVCHVSHAGGFTRKYQVDMPADGKGAKGGDVMTKTHAIGAGMTYGQRYLLKLIFNMAVGDDNDGNETDPTPISDDQLRALIDLADEVGADKPKLCKYLKIPALAELPAARFKDAVAALESKRTK